MLNFAVRERSCSCSCFYVRTWLIPDLWSKKWLNFLPFNCSAKWNMFVEFYKKICVLLKILQTYYIYLIACSVSCLSLWNCILLDFLRGREYTILIKYYIHIFLKWYQNKLLQITHWCHSWFWPQVWRQFCQSDIHYLMDNCFNSYNCMCYHLWHHKHLSFC